MTYKYIRVCSEGEIVTLYLNRPEVLNALNNLLMQELLDAFTSLPETTRLVMLRGAGGVSLAAGADLNEMGQRSMWSEMDFGVRRELARRLSSAPFLTLAVIEGFALGGGMELALACHLRVAKSDATVGLPETRLGIVPGNGGATRLTQLVGVSRALQLILLGEHLKADEAFDLGIINWVFSPESFDDELENLKRKLGRLSPLSTRAVIDSVYKSVDLPVHHSIENEQRWFQLCMESPDKREGLNAFFEKRQANFAANNSSYLEMSGK